ncbi:MAG: hypothetical protein IKP40_09075 [Clostridia bacterium]|nr:hypothetical protein [Clostridia bacterium]
MKYAVKLSVNGTADIIAVPDQRDWRWYPGQIGCEYFENVYPHGLEDPYMMIVDEEGLLKEKPVVNFFASWLYETHRHGHPIVGDALIMKQIETDDGPEIGGMEKAEAEAIQLTAHSRFPEASAAVEKALAGKLVRS